MADAQPLWARRAGLTVDVVQMPPDGLGLSSYVESMVWARPTEDASNPNQETASALIDYWRPFD